MNNGVELIEALNQIEKEKGIDKEVIFEAIEMALVSACKKNFGSSQNIKVLINRETGKVDVYAQKEVVDEVKSPQTEISVEDAKAISKKYGLGDFCEVVVTPKNFGRISAQTAKQLVVQKFREEERKILYNQYISKEREVITGVVQRKEKRNVIVDLGKMDGVLAPSDQVPGEEYEFNQRIKVYVTEVRQTPKGPQIMVSRTHSELIKRLFEQEVPEVFDGTVEIMSIAREAGSRTKIAVYSKNPAVDPVGACVGQNGFRVNIIVNEINGEKIDIVKWDPDPKKFIAAALSPSNVVAAEVGQNEQSAKVVVPDYQLSLAIGKEGQNARLAAKLTGWKIDIKSESVARETGFISFTQQEMLGDGYEEEYYDDEYYDGEYYEGEEYYDDDEYYEGEYYEEGEYGEEYYDEEYYDENGEYTGEDNDENAQNGEPAVISEEPLAPEEPEKELAEAPVEPVKKGRKSKK